MVWSSGDHPRSLHLCLGLRPRVVSFAHCLPEPALDLAARCVSGWNRFHMDRNRLPPRSIRRPVTLRSYGPASLAHGDCACVDSAGCAGRAVASGAPKVDYSQYLKSISSMLPNQIALGLWDSPCILLACRLVCFDRMPRSRGVWSGVAVGLAA